MRQTVSRAHPRWPRRIRLWTVPAVVLALTLAAGATASLGQGAAPAGPKQQKIAAIAGAAMAKYHLKALIVRVTTDGRNTYT